jgi:hypothetical protein
VTKHAAPGFCGDRGVITIDQGRLKEMIFRNGSGGIEAGSENIRGRI